MIPAVPFLADRCGATGRCLDDEETVNKREELTALLARLDLASVDDLVLERSRGAGARARVHGVDGLGSGRRRKRRSHGLPADCARGTPSE